MIASYTHNATGQRVSKTVGAATTHFLYGPGGLIGEADGDTGAVQAEYVWLGGMPLAYIQGGAVYYIHPDHLGTPQRLTGAGGSLAWDASYTPFGEAGVTGTLTFNLRFPGQYHDAETGYYDNWYRTYDPTLGRYIQSDPIGLGGGWNTYAYVTGNPVMGTDPRGLDCVKVGTTVTCNAPGGGPTVSFPAPDGWPDLINEQSPNYHDYDIKLDASCSYAPGVLQGIIDNPTPGSPEPATGEGTLNDASPSAIADLYYSPVKSYKTTDQNGNTVVVNVTEPDHPLWPGYVARTVEETSSGTTVHNYGEGTNWKQNEWIYKGGNWNFIAKLVNGSVWYSQTQPIIDDNANACGCWYQ